MRKLLLSAAFAVLLVGSAAVPSAEAQLFRRGRLFSPGASSSANPIYVYSSPTQSGTPSQGSTNSISYYPGGAGYEPQFQGKYSNPTSETPSYTQGSTAPQSYYPGGAGYEPQFHGPYRYPTYDTPIYSQGSASSSYYPGGASYEPQYNYNYPSYRSGR